MIYLEGSRNGEFRMLRAVKNRFGRVGEGPGVNCKGRGHGGLGQLAISKRTCLGRVVLSIVCSAQQVLYTASNSIARGYSAFRPSSFAP